MSAWPDRPSWGAPDAGVARLGAVVPLRKPGRAPSDGRFRAAQELTGLAWWELDLRTGKHLWSDQMFRLVGLEPADSAPSVDEFVQLMHPDDRPAAQGLHSSGFTTGHREVFRVVHPDGSVHYLASWTEVQRDEAGEPVTVVGATIDVTERELALESVAVGRAQLAAALELSATAMWEWDVRVDQVTWSHRMVELMGRDPESGPPSVDDFLNCVHPDDRQRMRELGERTVATGIPDEAVYRVVHPDGGERHVRAWTDVRTSHGVVTHLWGTAMDITRQEEHAARIKSSEEHFRVAFEMAPIGMAMISLSAGTEGQFLSANEAFQRMLGRTEDELIGMHITVPTPEDDRARTQTLFTRLLSGEERSLGFEKRYVHADGHIVHAWLTSSVLYGVNGKPLYLLTHAVDISERLHEQAELKRLALTDTLTGLANRTLLNDRLQQSLARLERHPGAVAMLLLDVDRFKLVNDSLGHQVGDSLLMEIARRIQAVTRDDSTVARLGGDEFVVLVEGAEPVGEMHAIAERVLEALRQPYQLGPEAPALAATLSMGISIAVSSDRTPRDLYREADLALYRAKASGRDQYALFDEALRASTDRRLAAEALLRGALSEDRLVPVFQPIVDLVDGRIHAAEALVRIQEGDRLILPVDFIEVAEETGLIVELDARMMEMGVAEVARMSRAGVPLRRLTTNVSAKTLEDGCYVDRMRAALARHELPGSVLRVELTERSLLTASAVVRSALSQIQAMGALIGLDDFGTGYSSLAYLHTFPLAFLKIDRTFVSRLGVSARDDAVVAAVVDLAHAHDLIVIGEGVETVEQLAALRRVGCDRGQGYLMGRPMSALALEALLRSDPRW